jgi:hypothetical protein
LGRVVLAHAGGSEFALLLARRMDDDPTQYEVVEVNSPITLLAFALHRYFRSAWWPLCQRSPARTAQTPIDCASQRWAGHKRIEPELGWPSDELRAQEERRPGAQADRGSIATRQSVGNAPEASRTDS